MNNQRRIFLKVIATGPLVGCAGADPDSSLPDGVGGSGGETTGGSAGGASSVGGASTSGGSSAFPQAGSAAGGNPFSSGGNGLGGYSFSAGTGSTAAGTGPSVGGTGSAGTGTSNGSLTPAGHVSSVPVGALVIAAGLFFIGRDSRGIYAMSMQCTHKGCAVALSGRELECPCHKARFDLDGNVLAGPAPAPLPHLAVFVDAAGNITVDRYTVVAGSVRTAV